MRRLLGGTFHYGLGSVLPKLIRFLLLPVFILFLAPEDYGLLEISASLGAMVTLTMRMGVPGAATRYYFEHSEGEGLKDYVTTLAWFLTAASVVIGAIAALLHPWLEAQFFPGFSFWPYFALTLAGAMIGANAELQNRLIQAREQTALAARLNIIRAVISIAFALLFVVVLRWGAKGVLLGELAAQVWFFVQAQIYLKPDLRGRFSRVALSQSLRYGLAILPSHLMVPGAQLAVAAVLTDGASLAVLGLYAVAQRFIRPGDIVLSAFTVAYAPIYFAARKAGTHEEHDRLVFAQAIAWFLAVAMVLGIATVGPPVVELMTPLAYHPAAALLPVLGLGMGAQLLTSIVTQEIFFDKRTWLLPFISVVRVGTTVGLTIALIGPAGLMGVAWAQTIGAFVGLTLTWIVTAGRNPVRQPWGDLLRPAACAGLSFALWTVLAPVSQWSRLVLSVAVLALFLGLLAALRDRAFLAAARWMLARMTRRRSAP